VVLVRVAVEEAAWERHAQASSGYPAATA
jgi:hypothetical protein